MEKREPFWNVPIHPFIIRQIVVSRLGPSSATILKLDRELNDALQFVRILIIKKNLLSVIIELSH